MLCPFYWTEVHGNWTDWSKWSVCSETCGGGIRHKYRICSNPAPANGGNECSGIGFDLRLCNEQPCPGRSKRVWFSNYSSCTGLLILIRALTAQNDCITICLIPSLKRIIRNVFLRDSMFPGRTRGKQRDSTATLTKLWPMLVGRISGKPSLLSALVKVIGSHVISSPPGGEIRHGDDKRHLWWL